MDTEDATTMIPPRYQRLSDELAEAIHGGRLPVGSRLPSLRQMASQRQLSLNTVIAAYRQLEDAGLGPRNDQAGDTGGDTLFKREFHRVLPFQPKVKA